MNDGKEGRSLFGIARGHDPKALQKEIKKLEAKMHKAAGDLEFEEAAKLRDEIKRLESLDLQVR